MTAEPAARRMPVWASARYLPDGTHAVEASVGDVSFDIHESDAYPGCVNVEADANLTGALGLRIHVNDQLIWDSRGAGGDLDHLTALTGYDLANAVGPALGDAVRESCCVTNGTLGKAATLTDYIDGAIAFLQALRAAAEDLR